MSGYFIFSSMPVKDFCHSEKGAQAVYLVAWGQLAKAQQHIGSYFSRTGGNVTMKSLYSLDPDNGESIYTLIASVKKAGRTRKKRGRPCVLTENKAANKRETQVYLLFDGLAKKSSTIHSLLQEKENISISRQRVDQIIKSLIKKEYLEKVSRGIYQPARIKVK